MKFKLLLWPMLALTGFAAHAYAADDVLLTLPASIEAFESSDQYAKDSGFVTEVKADMGDHVASGQVLAVIDDPELLRQLDAAKATLGARQEMVKAADATIQQSEKNLQVAQSQVAVYRSDLEMTQITLKREEELYSAKAATAQQTDEIRAKANSARAQMDVAESRVAMAQADVTSAQAARSVAQAQVLVAEAEAHRLEALLQYTNIKAPFDGLVTRRMVNRGDLVTAGRSMPLFTIQHIDTVRVFCDVPEGNLAGIAAGNPAVIKPYALPGQTFEAKVTRVAGALDSATRTMRIEIDVPNPKEILRPGMYAQVTLTLRTATSAPATKP